MSDGAPLRCLVIGTGSIGRRHIANVQALRPEVVFACVRDDRRQDDISTRLRASVFATVEEALAWRPDIAIVANPSDRHAAVLQPLLAHRIACFIEKPVVIAGSDLARLATVDPTIPTQVGCVLRFLPSLQHLRAQVMDGRLGAIVRATLEVGQYLADWRPGQDHRASYSASIARGGGVVFDLVHEIDLACWLFGDVALLGAWGDTLSDLGIESEDVATLVLRGAAREQIAIQLDYVARSPVRRIHIVGDRGSAVWDLSARMLRLTDAMGKVEVIDDGFDLAPAYVTAMEELITARETGSATRLPLHEGLKATGIAIAANTLIRSRKGMSC